MVIKNLFIWSLVFLFLGACVPCDNIVKSVFSPQQCRSLDLAFQKGPHSIVAASCGSVTNSRKISFNCPSSAGSFGFCNAAAQGSMYYFILVPNNNAGTFVDSTAGQINSCAELWSAITSATPPTDIVGAYFTSSDPTDTLNCNASGCNFASVNCVASWDAGLQAPTSNPISIVTSTKLLVCGFIDVQTNPNVAPAGPPPIPGSGVISTSVSTSFFPLTVNGTLNFNSWIDY